MFLKKYRTDKNKNLLTVIRVVISHPKEMFVASDTTLVQCCNVSPNVVTTLPQWWSVGWGITRSFGPSWYHSIHLLWVCKNLSYITIWAKNIASFLHRVHGTTSGLDILFRWLIEGQTGTSDLSRWKNPAVRSAGDATSDGWIDECHLVAVAPHTQIGTATSHENCNRHT